MKLYKDIAESLTQAKVDFLENENLSRHTTFKVGGPAKILVRPSSVEGIIKVLEICKNTGVTYMVMGNGSNILALDKGYDGVIIKISSRFNNITVDGEYITCESGAMLSALCRNAVKNSLAGLEFASGIPGTVGGGIYMNAGAYGGEIMGVIETAVYIDEDGEIKELTVEEMNFDYRHSVFSNRNVTLLSAKFHLKRGNYDHIANQTKEIAAKRVLKQPTKWPSAGSVFKRPKGAYAAALIDQCELKGLTVGGAQISEKHAGFIINIGGATGSDVLSLIDKVKEVVFNETGYNLELEVKVI